MTFKGKTPKIIFVSFVFVLLLSGKVVPQSYIPTSDTGIIKEILGDRIYLEGKLGAYVLEMVTTCPWCETGINVAVHFQSFSRALMTPNPNPLQISGVQTFILRDARDNAY
ncbi:MAG: hypothetical protein ACP5U1_09390 [Desulfomonilaceae bacterium]